MDYEFLLYKRRVNEEIIVRNKKRSVHKYIHTNSYTSIYIYFFL